MKTTLSIAVVLVFTCQTLKAQSFGLHIGGNLASGKVKDPAIIFPLSPESKFGFLGGLVAEIPLAKAVSFRPELNFIQKGFKVSFSENFGTGTVSVEGKETLNYLELPLNFTYNLPAGSNEVFIGAGPSVGLGLSGEHEMVTSFPGLPVETEKGDTKFGNDEVEDDYKSLDFGLNVNGGYQMAGGFFVKLAYTFGLTNISNDPARSVKNKGFSFSLGYLFSKAAK